MSVASLISVAASGALELWAGLGLGAALGLPAASVALASGVGAWLGCIAALLLAQPLMRWMPSKQTGLAYKLAQRYGAPGLGLLGVLLAGGPLAVLIGVAFRLPWRPLLAWLTAGIAAWSAVGWAVLVFGRSLLA
ncbi:hypothetical protein FNU76_23720 [Chitinimonas arctica]|uniref:DedA family protein n=1 Tax=Chitinimonas arctica TaxID=2594795 RepID=A0A516SLS3_9NEIS|nr:hypothetical protein [Chitinimonas arctica]QDQ29114.1 hypothetical protein FNU76_23720 [Chitinimonas arctica]